MPRNYAKEYKTYYGEPEQIKRRDARNKVRVIMVKKGWYGKKMEYIVLTKTITH